MATYPASFTGSNCPAERLSYNILKCFPIFVLITKTRKASRVHRSFINLLEPHHFHFYFKVSEIFIFCFNGVIVVLSFLEPKLLAPAALEKVSILLAAAG